MKTFQLMMLAIVVTLAGTQARQSRPDRALTFIGNSRQQSDSAGHGSEPIEKPEDNYQCTPHFSSPARFECMQRRPIANRGLGRFTLQHEPQNTVIYLVVHTIRSAQVQAF